MTYLFLFAHPDDETVACASTIKQLVDQGDEVVVVTATDGSAGEVHERSQSRLTELGSVGEIRRAEMKQVAQFLNVSKLHILDFTDGQVTNEQVWGKLMSTFIDLIEQYRPTAVVTFDHTGWYYHLDHVGVSIAATLAVQKANYQVPLFFFAHMRVRGSKWKYVFPEQLPITHVVDAQQHAEFKLQALELHHSQNIELVKQKVLEESPHQEMYQLVSATTEGQKILKNHAIFHPVTKTQ